MHLLTNLMKTTPSHATYQKGKNLVRLRIRFFAIAVATLALFFTQAGHAQFVATGFWHVGSVFDSAGNAANLWQYYPVPVSDATLSLEWYLLNQNGTIITHGTTTDHIILPENTMPVGAAYSIRSLPDSQAS